jgi:hypothetical protein
MKIVVIVSIAMIFLSQGIMFLGNPNGLGFHSASLAIYLIGLAIFMKLNENKP